MNGTQNITKSPLGKMVATLIVLAYLPLDEERGLALGNISKALSRIAAGIKKAMPGISTPAVLGDLDSLDRRGIVRPVLQGGFASWPVGPSKVGG